MDGLGGCYAKWNKLDKERQILYDITCMLNLKYTKTSEYNKKEAHRSRERTSGYRWGDGRRGQIKGKGIKRYKLLGIK